MKVRKGTYVMLDDRKTVVYVLKGTNKEDGYIEVWEVNKGYSFGIYANHVTEKL